MSKPDHKSFSRKPSLEPILPSSYRSFLSFPWQPNSWKEMFLFIFYHILIHTSNCCYLAFSSPETAFTKFTSWLFTAKVMNTFNSFVSYNTFLLMGSLLPFCLLLLNVLYKPLFLHYYLNVSMSQSSILGSLFIILYKLLLNLTTSNMLMTLKLLFLA